MVRIVSELVHTIDVPAWTAISCMAIDKLILGDDLLATTLSLHWRNTFLSLSFTVKL
jgi:hypothetical protein